MKLKIWSKKAAAAEKNKDQLFVKLVYAQLHKEDIVLVIVDINGKIIEKGNILYLDNDLKCLIQREHISKMVPLKTNMRGAVFCVDEEEGHRLCRDIQSVISESSFLEFLKSKTES